MYDPADAIPEYAGFIADVLGKNITIMEQSNGGRSERFMCLTEGDRLWGVLFLPEAKNGRVQFTRFAGKHMGIPADSQVDPKYPVDMEFHVFYNLEGPVTHFDMI